LRKLSLLKEISWNHLINLSQIIRKQNNLIIRARMIIVIVAKRRRVKVIVKKTK